MMKPSKIGILKAKKTWLLFSNFKGIMWMGTLYCREQKYVDEINKSDKINSTFKSHETIHVRQAQSMNDSWFKFYLNYCFQWLKNLPLLVININAPYLLIPTEIEAYFNQKNWSYAENISPVFEWKKYQELSLKEKKQIAKAYYDKNNHKSFSVILHEFL